MDFQEWRCLFAGEVMLVQKSRENVPLTKTGFERHGGEKNMKTIVCTISGMAASAAAMLFGGWNAGLTTLVLFMGIDYISGIIVAGVFRRSKKTKNGGLESKAGFKGLCRKSMMLLFVLTAARLDLMLSTTYIRDAVTIGFALNELLSIMENAGLMGIPFPKG